MRAALVMVLVGCTRSHNRAVMGLPLPTRRCSRAMRPRPTPLRTATRDHRDHGADVEANNKHFARLEVLRTMVEAVENEL